MPEEGFGTEVPAGTESVPAESATSEGFDSQSSTPEAAPALDFDQYGDHVVTVKVDGEERNVTLKEARDGYQRQEDYTRKTQELAERQREIDAYNQLNAAFAADPEGTLRALAQQAGVNLFEAPGDSESSEELDPSEARLRQLEEWHRGEEQRRNRELVDSTFQSLHDKFGDAVDDEALARYAVERNYSIDQLEDAFKAMTYDKAIEQARSAAEAERAQGEQDRAAAKDELPAVHGGASNGGPVKAGNKPVTSIRDAWAQAKAEHKISL